MGAGGWTHSAETKAKMSAVRKGRRVPLETRGRMSEAQRGEKAANWQGGRTLTTHGYVLIKVGRDHPMARSTGYVLEHRLAMSGCLGRPLEPEETVHHRLECEGGSGDIADNRIENLILFESRAEHMRHHKQLERGE